MMYYIMHRTQILLDRWQYERLKAVAEREGTSISSLVRGAVTRFLESVGSEDATRLSDITGIARDPDSTGRDHDDPGLVCNGFFPVTAPDDHLAL